MGTFESVLFKGHSLKGIFQRAFFKGHFSKGTFQRPLFKGHFPKDTFQRVLFKGDFSTAMHYSPPPHCRTLQIATSPATGGGAKLCIRLSDEIIKISVKIFGALRAPKSPKFSRASRANYPYLGYLRRYYVFLNSLVSLKMLTYIWLLSKLGL